MYFYLNTIFHIVGLPTKDKTSDRNTQFKKIVLHCGFVSFFHSLKKFFKTQTKILP